MTTDNQYGNSFRKLIVWQEAKILTLKIYKITTAFPQHELYGIVSQLRRSSSSIMANIAEGNNRRTKNDKIRFFTMAQSSLCETDCFLELAYELQYLSKEKYSLLLDQLNKTAFLLNKLIRSL